MILEKNKVYPFRKQAETDRLCRNDMYITVTFIKDRKRTGLSVKSCNTFDFTAIRN